MLLGNLRIRGKLALLVAIPLLAVVALAIPVVLDRVDQSRRAADTARAVRTAGQVRALIQNVQQERLLSVGFLLRLVDPARLQTQVQAVTRSAADAKAGLGAHPPAGLVQAIDAVGGLAATRTKLQTGAVTPDVVISAYGGVVTGIITALRLEDVADATTAQGRQVIGLDTVFRIDEGIAVGTADLLVAVTTKNPQAVVPVAISLAVLQSQGDRLGRFVTTDQAALYNKVRTEGAARLGVDLGAPNLDMAAAVGQMSAPTLLPNLESLIGVNRQVEQKIIDDVTGRVTSQQNRALGMAYFVGGGAVLILLVVLALVLVVGRAVVRPLTRLTVSADRVARLTEAELVRVADEEVETPAPVQLEAIEVGGRDEIGELARAFERVQGTAARLVERQAASRRNVAQMFGHVGRRTQNLVGRQISLIDRLERHETDPGRLQDLYRLDHVSSRLARNADSLVVLSGASGAADQLRPLPLTDVVRLALGEIEDYPRVDVQVAADLALLPAVINDMVLLFAELMENATVFSPPHTRVLVAAQATANGAQVAIVDHGLGLPPERLAEENARLARRERLDLAPTEVLGLFVIGRLARRHGLDVALWPTPGGGVTATVAIPDRLLAVAQHPFPTVAPAFRPAAPAEAVLAAADTQVLLASTPKVTAAITGTQVPRLPEVVPVDQAALHRASRSIEDGGSWNAFIPRQRNRSIAAMAGDGAAATPAVAAPPLRQRIPGAQLPEPTVAELAPPSDPSEAVLAQALVEDFEAGVRRAQQHAATQPAPLVGTAVRPAGAAPLTRRVPGATLEPEPAPVTGGKGGGTVEGTQPSSSPDEVRDLVEQFESGVRRALRDAHAQPK